jgi:hypothetical protein
MALGGLVSRNLFMIYTAQIRLCVPWRVCAGNVTTADSAGFLLRKLQGVYANLVLFHIILSVGRF